MMILQDPVEWSGLLFTSAPFAVTLTATVSVASRPGATDRERPRVHAGFSLECDSLLFPWTKRNAR